MGDMREEMERIVELLDLLKMVDPDEKIRHMVGTILGMPDDLFVSILEIQERMHLGEAASFAAFIASSQLGTMVPPGILRPPASLVHILGWAEGLKWEGPIKMQTTKTMEVVDISGEPAPMDLRYLSDIMNGDTIDDIHDRFFGCNDVVALIGMTVSAMGNVNEYFNVATMHLVNSPRFILYFFARVWARGVLEGYHHAQKV